MAHALPSDPMGQRLWEIFGVYPWSFLELNDGDRDWRTENRYPLRPRTLWKRWQDAATQVGVRFGSQTSYAVIDIDKGSPFLNSSAVNGIREALETIGIVRTLPVRSSWSDGLHLFCPLPESVGTFNLAVAIKGCLSAHGFDLEEGKLEAMPNVKSYGRSWVKEFVEYQGHRIPLQPFSGSMILNDNFQPVSDKLEYLFWSWDVCSQQQDMELLAQAIATAKQNRRKHKKVETPFAQWRSDLKNLINEGWTDFGQTNVILKAIATHGRVFERLDGLELAEYTEDTARHLPGFDRWCRHTHEIAKKALCWARSVEKYYYPAGSEILGNVQPNPAQSENTPDGNKARSWDAQRRILKAFKALWDEQRETLTTVSEWATALVERAKCSTRTLYRHIELWHPTRSDAHRAMAEGMVIPHAASDTPSPEPSQTATGGAPTESLEPLLINAFLHLGGGMKSETDETSHKKILSPGGKGGCGGNGRFSTGDLEE